MQDLEEKSVRNIINDILTERAEDFSWTCLTPDYYEDEDEDYENDFDNENETEDEQSPTFITLSSIRILCDSIHTNLANSGTANESFLNMELMDIENKLREINDNLSSLQNFNNNQQQILTGDIILA